MIVYDLIIVSNRQNEWAMGIVEKHKARRDRAQLGENLLTTDFCQQLYSLFVYNIIPQYRLYTIYTYLPSDVSGSLL